MDRTLAVIAVAALSAACELIGAWADEKREIPAEVLFVPMGLARPERAYRYAVIATVGSVLGGIFGWYLGYYAYELIARPILEFYGSLERFEALRTSSSRDAILLMLITSGLAHLPPMKVVTVLSGAATVNLWLFIASAIASDLGIASV